MISCNGFGLSIATMPFNVQFHLFILQTNLLLMIVCQYGLNKFVCFENNFLLLDLLPL